jgi:lipoprotein LprG
VSDRDARSTCRETAAHHRILRLIGIVFLTGALLVSCSRRSSVETPPDGNKLLRDSADAMSQVTSAAFSLTIVGDLRAVPVSSAQGIAARQGQNGRASISAVLAGQSKPIRYVVVDGNAYLSLNDKWQRVPLGNYDPSLFLDANQGIASTLGRATDGHVQGSEPVHDTDCYKVSGTFPTDLLHLLSIVTPTETTPATVWIGKRSNQFLKTEVTLQFPGADKPTRITLVLSDLNKPMTIEAPSVP